MSNGAEVVEGNISLDDIDDKGIVLINKKLLINLQRQLKRKIESMKSIN